MVIVLLFRSVVGFAYMLSYDTYGTEDGSIESYSVHIGRLIFQIPQVLLFSSMVYTICSACYHTHYRQSGGSNLQ